jgi:hypothetical protein
VNQTDYAAHQFDYTRTREKLELPCAAAEISNKFNAFVRAGKKLKVAPFMLIGKATRTKSGEAAS